MQLTWFRTKVSNLGVVNLPKKGLHAIGDPSNEARPQHTRTDPPLSGLTTNHCLPGTGKQTVNQDRHISETRTYT
jgi:hypothetical protein